MKHLFELNGYNWEVWLSPCQQGYRLHLPGGTIKQVAFSHQSDGSGLLVIEGDAIPVKFAIDGDTIHLHIRGRTHSLRYLDPLRALACDDAAAEHLVARAPMPGLVVATKVSQDDVVAAGTALMLIESMKLEIVIYAPRHGRVDQIHFREGESFERDATLITLSETGR
ncbi:hypothetical protein AYJ54_19005 [Bradyrhizobium centrolobii]|uniref:Lipoyl-binding domain-containing protein n=1 Tax=Bradyrhizobium centrolobii TaxID=1505087 RepID=A0A176YJB8_9BRAD|nr:MULTISPECIES: acetyl-CoA carboxylase biotin carboxyl carrier protein subunit [Bradyrhizobium]OAF06910.1 hypothetical protein AYJ54_19005 [Bradyrhizobium centrolobii]